MQPTSIRRSLSDFIRAARSADFGSLFVLFSVTLLTLVSWYFASRRFFRTAISPLVSGNPLAQLYEYLYWFTADCLVYFLLPVLLIRLVLKRPLSSFGIGAGEWRFGLKITTLFVAVMIPILWIVSASPEFQAVYPHAGIVRSDWNLFLVYELFFLLYFIGWEFIWRGYLLFGLEERLGGPVAVLVQTVPFVILHFGKPFIESFGAVFAGIALGALALRTRSFFYCVLTHWSVMIIIDLISILRYRTGRYGTGFADLIDIVEAIF